MKKIPENVTLIIKAVVPLIAIIGLFFVLGNIGITKVKEIQAQISASREERSVLTEKLDILRTVAVTGVEDSNAAASSLPDTSPALAVISQLKYMAAESGLILSSAKARTNESETSDINSVVVSFTITGVKPLVNEFLLNTASIAPITLLTNVKISETGGVYSGDITANTFWAALPTQLPASIEEFQDLTELDKEILAIVSGLRQPVFFNLPPAESAGRENPFTQ